MANIQLFFVKIPGQEPGIRMNEAFQTLTEKLEEDEPNCHWVEEAHCFTVKEKKRNHIFVFEEFGSEAFNYIVSIGIKCYGPMCIMACLKNDIPLPQAHPIFSLAMQGYVLSCTNILKENREALHKKIGWMAGEISKDFHDVVTHLIAGEVGSKKYRVAANLEKQIMSPEWVDAALEFSKNKMVNANDPLLLRKYKCPVFKGLVITVSGLETKERNEIKEMVEGDGGRYTGEMKMEECTHLVISKPKGQKYEFAKKWQLLIVTPKWVSDSINAGYCQEEMRYKVMDDVNISIQQPTSTPTRQGKGPRLSVLGDVSAISLTHVDDTAQFNSTVNSTVNQSLQNQLNRPGSSSGIGGADPLESLDIVNWKGDYFLDGCKIFTSGFSAMQMEKLKKILNLGGAVRFNDISESATHIIIGKRIEEHIKQIESLSSRPHVVTLDWLIESFKAVKCVPEKLFSYLDLLQVEPASPHLSKVKLKNKSSVQRPFGNDGETSFQAPPTSTPMDADGMQDIMSQYLPQNEGTNTNTFGESTLVKMAEEMEFAVADQPEKLSNNNKSNSENQMKGRTEEKTTEQQNFEDMETQDPNDETVDQEDEDQPFKEKSFIIIGFNEEQTSDLHKFITECGGDIAPLNTRRIPDYAVVPIMGYPVERTVHEVVTNAWLQISVEQGQIQPIDGNEIFTPLNPKDEFSVPLEGTVLSVSGYQGTERDVISHIAQILGAVCQDFFVRKAQPRKNLLANTHLIVNSAEGSKYEAALKWNIPAVDKSWVIACAKASKKLLEAGFLVGKINEAPVPVESKPSVTVPEKTSRITNVVTQVKRTASQEKMPPPTTAPPVKKSRLSRNGDANNLAGDKSLQNKDNKKASSSELRRSSRGNTSNSSSSSDDDQKVSGKKNNRKEESVHNNTTDMLMGEINTGELDLREQSNTVKQSLFQGTSMTDDDNNDITHDNHDSTVQDVSANMLESHNINDPDVTMDVEETASSSKGIGSTETMSSLQSVPKAVNPKIQKLISDNRKSSPKPSTSKDGSGDESDGWETPSKFLTEGVMYRPNFDLTEAYACVDAMDTPGRTPKAHRRNSSISLEDMFTMQLDAAIKRTGTIQNVPQEVPQDSPAAFKLGTPRPLRGVIIAVSKKLLSKQSDYNNIASSLGADYRWTYDGTCTHYLFQGRKNDMNKEFRKAKDDEKIIVSPHWLLACQEQNCKVDESLYPHTYNPNLSLSITTTKTPARNTRATRNSRSRVQEAETTPLKQRTMRGTRQSVKSVLSDSDTSSIKGQVEKVIEGQRTTRNQHTKTKSESSSSVDGDITKENTSENELNIKKNSDKNISSTTLQKKVTSDLERTLSDDDISKACEDVESEDNNSKSDSLINDIKKLMAMKGKSYGKQRGPKFQRSELSYDKLNDDSPNTTPQSAAKRSRPQSKNNSQVEDEVPLKKGRQSRNSNPPAPETQASQMIEVTWDDPKAREQQEKLASDLAKYSQSLSPTEEHNQFKKPLTNKHSVVREDEHQDWERTPSPKAPPLALPVPKSHNVSPPKPVDVYTDSEDNDTTREEDQTMETEASTNPPMFQMSGIEPKERVDYGALVAELNGDITEAVYYDPRCSHLVVAQPSRNEKYLACVAAGKWILHKSYFEACRQEKIFVKEDMYEWGSEYTRGLCANSSLVKLAIAARRWRTKLHSSRKTNPSCKGAFDGWKVLLVAKREQQFVRLLEAGGAQIMSTVLPFTNLEGVTHAFLDWNKIAKDIPLTNLVNADIHCCKLEYISAYLMDEPTSEPSSYYVEGVKDLLKGRRASGSSKRKYSVDDLPCTPSKRKKQM